jgi:hypothetical protein
VQAAEEKRLVKLPWIDEVIDEFGFQALASEHGAQPHIG